MSVSLQKGQKVSLSKDNAGLSKVIVGLGWDEAPQGKRGFFAPKPQPIDCDDAQKRKALCKRGYHLFWQSQAPDRYSTAHGR